MGFQKFKSDNLTHFVYNLEDTEISKENILNYFKKESTNKTRFYLTKANQQDIDFEIRTKSFYNEDEIIGYLKIDEWKKQLFIFSINRSGIPLELILDLEVFLIKKRNIETS